jgi:outer membrane protein
MKHLTAIMSAMALMTVPSTMAETWTLDSCISYAIDHNITVRTRQAEQLGAEYSVTEAKDKFLPQASAYASQTFNFGRGLTSENTYANRNTQNFAWGVNLQMPVFQGLSALRGLDYAKANLRTYVEQVEAVKDDVTLNVMSQYLQVLYCGEIYDVATEQVHLDQVELQRRRDLLEHGKIAEVEVLEAESQLAQDELTQTTAANDRTMAIVDLCQLLRLDDIADFQPAPLEDNGMPLLSADDVYQNALIHNHALKASRLSVEAADKNIAVAKTGYLPTLSFNAGIGSSYYKVSDYVNSSFSSQMRENFNKVIGFSLSIPLFDAFSTRNSLRRAKMQRLTAELTLEDNQSKLYQAIQQAYYQALAANKKAKSAEVAVKSTLAAFEAMQLKYEYGKATSTEFEQSKAAYIKARSELVQVRYESLLRIRILQFYNRN